MHIGVRILIAEGEREPRQEHRTLETRKGKILAKHPHSDWKGYHIVRRCSAGSYRVGNNMLLLPAHPHRLLWNSVKEHNN